MSDAEGRTPSLAQRLRYGPFQAWINSPTSNPVVVRSDGITQVRVPFLARIVLWGGPGMGWTLFTLGCRYSWPAHPSGFVPFWERQGLRKTYHLFGGCLVPPKRRRKP